MQRLEEKQDGNTKQQYLAFKNSGVAAVLDIEKLEIAHHFQTSNEAQNFKLWLEQQDFLNLADELPIAIQMENEEATFVVTLSQPILDTLLGNGYFANEAVKNVRDTFVECIKNNKLEKILLLLATPFFEAHPDNQVRLFGFTDADGNNFLQTAILKLNTEELKSFLAAIDPYVLDIAITHVNANGQTAVDLAIMKQSNAAFESLAKRLPKDALTACIIEQPELSEKVLQTQKPAVAAYFFKHLEPVDAPVEIPHRCVLQIADYLLHEPTWQDRELVEKAFVIAGETLALIGYQFWLDGNEISETFKSSILQYAMDDDRFAEKNALASYIPTTNSALAKEGKLNAVTTAKGTVIPLAELADPRTAETLKQEGVASIQDYRILRKFQRNIPHLSFALDQLYYPGRALANAEPEEEKYNLPKGLPALENPAAEMAPAFNGIKALFERDDALVQRIDLIDLDKYQLQLEDHNYRPPVRKPIQQHGLTHKFDHLSNTIVEYQPKRDIKLEERKQAKKMPMTHVTSQLNNALPGENDQNDTHVYLLLDKKDCVIKAMLAKSHKTRDRKWVGSYDDVEEYAATHGLSSKTTFAEFNEETKAHPHQLNKVLAKPTREAVRAIVIPMDSALSRLKARMTAQSFASNGEAALIIFYDRALRKIRPYLPGEQSKDQLKLTSSMRLMARAIQTEPENFTYYYGEALPDIASAMIHPITHARESFLQIAAANPSETLAFLRLANLSPLAEREIGLLLQTNFAGFNALHLALSTHGDAVTPLFRTVRCEALQATLRMNTSAGENYLHIAARELSSPNFIEFISALTANGDHSAIAEAIAQKNDSGVTALNQAAETQSPEAFSALLALCSPASINTAYKKEADSDKSIIAIAMQHQSAANIISLLNALDNDTWNIMFYRKGYPELINQICDNIVQNEEWQNAELINKLLNHPQLGITLLGKVEAHWLEGKDVPATAFACTQTYLGSLPAKDLSESLTELKAQINSANKEMAEWNEQHPRLLMTSKHKVIRLQGRREDTLKLIWQEGVASWEDYRHLRQQCHIAGMTEVLNALKDANCVRSGLFLPYKAGEINGHALREADARARLMALRHDIEAKPLARFSLFRTNEQPATLVAVRSLIQQAEDNAANWTESYEAVEKALTVEATKPKPWSRNQETQDFYVAEVHKIFNRR
ncbi:MAG: hypothetical protein P4M14_13680 [Gammaproteobacteria bacterium]|nr:hypothetical protein [Gammaproteobacteria bacterium]